MIPLDGASEPSRAHSLEVIYTPGHTTDSITLYDPEVRGEMDVTFKLAESSAHSRLYVDWKSSSCLANQECMHVSWLLPAML